MTYVIRHSGHGQYLMEDGNGGWCYASGIFSAYHFRVKQSAERCCGAADRIIAMETATSCAPNQ